MIIERIIKKIKEGEFYGNCYECERCFLEEKFIDYLNTISKATNGSLEAKDA